MEYRKHIRLKNFDYTSPSYYFITLCTNHRENLFAPRVSTKYGEILNPGVVAGPWPAQKVLNTNKLEEKLYLLEEKFPVNVDFYCIMPDHIHFIIALQKASQGLATTKLAWVVSAFKGWCTRAFGVRVFQPNFYEHVIRNENSLDKIRHYILYNPLVECKDISWNELDTLKG